MRHHFLPAYRDTGTVVPSARLSATTRHRSGATYLRVAITAKCPLRCSYCHREGDRTCTDQPLTTDDVIALVSVGLDLGIRKVKLLGGEPFLCADLPEIVAALRQRDGAADLSVITSGVAPAAKLDAVFAAGLDRCNLTIHGWSRAAFARRGGTDAAYEQRWRFVERLLEHGRPAKLNFVYGGPADDEDLAGLLAWAASRPLVVNVLDDLSREELDHRDIVAALHRLRGAAAAAWVEPDPHSLSTLHLRWPDGLEAEVKHERLGDLAPWSACDGCPARRRCREGIHALRLGHRGDLRLCMDRPDVRLELLPLLRAGGPPAVATAWRAFVETRVRC